MPRELKNKTATVVFRDQIAGGTCKLSYRIPTASEIQEYDSMRIRREGDKSFDNAATARIQMALKILTGIRDGDFTVDDKPISSDPQSEHYNEKWKDLVYDAGADILAFLGMFVFDKIPIDEKDSANPKEDGQPIAPFTTS